MPEGQAADQRASLLAWLARTRFLRGKFRDAVRDGREALAAAVDAGDRLAETEVLVTLGMAQIALGQVDDGVAHLRRAIELAREQDDLDGLTYAYANLADLLNLRGFTREALEMAQEGLANTPRRLGRAHDWMMLTVSELAFELGDWAEARAHLSGSHARQVGVMLIFRLAREADIALGEGDEDRAAHCLDELGALVATSSEPQWIGLQGAMLAELRRRRRDLAGARDAVAEALDRLELCTDDVMRIARVTGIGLRVEADFAQRARDLREPKDERDALARARIHMQRLRAAAQEGGPVEQAWMTTGAAELTRARGRSDPKLWQKAAARVGGHHPALPGGDRPLAGGRGAGRGGRPRRRRGRRRALRWTARVTWAQRWLAASSRCSPNAVGWSWRTESAATHHRRGRRARGGSVRADAARASGAGADRRGRHQPPDRGGALHGREDGERACLADPQQARGAQPHAGGGGRAPAASGVACERALARRMGAPRANADGLAVPS